MDQIYIVMLVVLGILAVLDLVVGVSNDAVNFLNSALGSKAVSFKTIMIVASVGIAVGAIFSSGMMEIARDGIITPSMFSFNDIMIIFLAVMVADILLLDVFNSIGLPTSTTVSIIFELLGAGVCLALIKIYYLDQNHNVYDFINTKKAGEIVYSILLSVGLSFALGSFIQYISRIIFTFQYEKKIKYFGAIFGGLAFTSIFYFLFIKGISDTPLSKKEVELVFSGATQDLLTKLNEFYQTNFTTLEQLLKAKKGFIKISENGIYSIANLTFKGYLEHYYLKIIVIGFVLFTLLSQLLMSVFKVNILRLIIIIGTFSLALAFSGNDLVNFIGVPLAALEGYNIFNNAGGVNAKTFMMGDLANDDIVAPFYYLILAGLVMVVTLWTSKKARSVIETELNLSRQTDGAEKFSPNFLSRYIVRGGIYLGQGINYFLPEKLQLKIDQRFEKIDHHKKQKVEAPMFDMIRASVNLVVASILISLGTSMKLPLSTTYVTFMVAMGSSFADRAWDRESAVYRIAGVFNVIGGWFITAFFAFIGAFTIAGILYFGETFAFFGIIVLFSILLYKNSKNFTKKRAAQEELKNLKREDIVTINEVINESSEQIAKVIADINKVYSDVIDNLGLQELSKLKDNKKSLKKLEKEIDELKSNIYFFIKNLDETSLEASKFYIMILGYLQDLIQSSEYITNNSYSHVNNNHKQLKFNQIRDLKSIDNELTMLYNKLDTIFKTKDFDQINLVLKEKGKLTQHISELLAKQIERIRTTETSPKNSKLYFGILIESNDLVNNTMRLLDLFVEFNHHVKSKK
ncbi:MAG: inorganic phosphate transporter [Flavobacterium sp.]